MNPILDRAGAPMIWIETLQAYLHWLPATKLQFETFMCDQPHPRFDQAWYENILKMNKRIEPPLIVNDTYPHAFLTGIRPSEVEDFVTWNNHELRGYYNIPTDKEWLTAYAELQQRPAYPDLEHLRDLNLTGRMRVVVERLQAVARDLTRGRSATLAEQMFLRKGVMEWVTRNEPNSSVPYAGRGDPEKRLGESARLEGSRPYEPKDTSVLDTPNKAFGFRLVRKES